MLEKLGKHTHSVTSMLSSLALLGETLGDRSLLERVRRFLEKGISRCALDFGWCLVGYLRTDLMGEINNTAESWKPAWSWPAPVIPATMPGRSASCAATCCQPSCLTPILSRATSTRPTPTATGCTNGPRRLRFPSPYGHEDSPGSRIMFNWDIVGGAVSGLCAAYRGALTRSGSDLALHLLLDSEYPELTSPFPTPNGISGCR